MREGYIAIIVVLMIAVAGILLASSMSLIGTGEIQSSVSLSKGEGVLSFVEGCAEDGLQKARANNNYGGGTISRPEGTCSITVSKNGTGNGATWTLTATGTSTAISNYTRTVQVIFVRNVNSFTITSWQEQ